MVLEDHEDLAAVHLVTGVILTATTVAGPVAVMVCSIFIASKTTRESPLTTRAPTSTLTLTAMPGIGATREPASIRDSGSAKRFRTPRPAPIPDL